MRSDLHALIRFRSEKTRDTLTGERTEMTIAEVQTVARLLLAQIRVQPGRLVITCISTIIAACIVVWVVSGYDGLMAEFDGLAEKYMGRYQVYLIPEGEGYFPSPIEPHRIRVSSELVDALRSDPAVARIDTAFQVPVVITTTKPASQQANDSNGSWNNIFRSRLEGGAQWQREASKKPVLVGTAVSEPPTRVIRGEWINAVNSDSTDAVLTSKSSETLGIDVGDEILVSLRPDGPMHKVVIVGIVEQPDELPPSRFIGGLPPARNDALLGGPAVDALYVSTSLAEKITEQPARASYAAIGLNPGIQTSDFLSTWSEQFAQHDPKLILRTAAMASGEIEVSTTLESARAQAMSATGIALLAALFIIFTTLSMGVHERTRQFAMLRAVALTKSQIGLWIVMESLVLGLIGWGGGLLAGWGMLVISEKYQPELVADGVRLGIWSVALSGLCALGGALAASILPAWRATTVSPLEAMVPRSHNLKTSALIRSTLLGLALIAVNPIVVFSLPVPDARRYAVSAALGCTSMTIGFILLAPGAILLAERVFSPVVARLLRLHPQLLTKQLSSNLWRSIGTSISLTLGLGLYVAMQTWGYSMLEPFVPGQWVPDLLVQVAPIGIADSDIEAVRNIPGIAANEFAPFVIEHVKFRDDPTGSHERESSSRQDSCVMIGIDPEAAIGGAKPLFDFKFDQGTRQKALAKLKQGRYCLVPDHFTRESGLGVGDKFAVLSNQEEHKAIEYEIAGVVSMPGWHWMAKIRFARSRVAGLMFADFETVRRDFHIDRATHFWMNQDGSRTTEEIMESIQPIAERNYDDTLARQVPFASALRKNAGLRDPVPLAISFRTAERVRQVVRDSADSIIWMLCYLPLVTLAVTSIGVANSVISSVRARQWDFGVLRAVGMTRFGLCRLILAEAILIGLVACTLSLGFGILAGYCGTGVTRYINIRGGQLVTLIVPWGHVIIGFALTLVLCLLAALIPALRTGWTETLALLKAGRSVQ